MIYSFLENNTKPNFVLDWNFIKDWKDSKECREKRGEERKSMDGMRRGRLGGRE